MNIPLDQLKLMSRSAWHETENHDKYIIAYANKISNYYKDFYNKRIKQILEEMKPDLEKIQMEMYDKGAQDVRKMAVEAIINICDYEIERIEKYRTNNSFPEYLSGQLMALELVKNKFCIKLSEVK